MAQPAGQFLFFIEYRLQKCEPVDDALEILPDVDVALARLDQAVVQIASDEPRLAPYAHSPARARTAWLSPTGSKGDGWRADQTAGALLALSMLVRIVKGVTVDEVLRQPHKTRLDSQVCVVRAFRRQWFTFLDAG